MAFAFSRRTLLGSALAGLAAAPALAVDAADLRGVTLRVGFYKGGLRAMLSAAGALDTPYTIDWKEMNNGVLHIEAINGDALDFGSGSEIPAMFAARQNANVRFIAVGHEDINFQVTIAGKSTGIRSIADLKGRRVGYVRATTAHYFLARQLEEAGLSFADIDAVNLAPADGYSAFVSGKIEAWAIYGYNVQLAITRNGARVLKNAVGYLSGNFPFYANPRALDDARRGAAIGDLLLRLQRAYAFANRHYPSFAATASAETHIPVADLTDAFAQRSGDYAIAGVTPDVVTTHQQVADTFLRLGVLDGKADVARFWDTRYNDLLAKGAAALPSG